MARPILLGGQGSGDTTNDEKQRLNYTQGRQQYFVEWAYRRREGGPQLALLIEYELVEVPANLSVHNSILLLLRQPPVNGVTR